MCGKREEGIRVAASCQHDSMKIVLLAHITVELQRRKFMTCHALCKPVGGLPLPEWRLGIG